MSTEQQTVEYAVLIVGDEAAYQSATPEKHAEVMGRHMEFARLLAERGHTVTGGAELTASTTSRILRPVGDGHTVTDGPFAEGGEQLGGFYTVRTSDLDDLVEVCKVLAVDGDTLEIRACVDHSGGES